MITQFILFLRIGIILSRNAMHSAAYAILWCLSVCHVRALYRNKTSRPKHILKLFSSSGNTVIQVFLHTKYAVL